MNDADNDKANARESTLLPTRYPWPHAPPHRLGGKGAYFVTCGTWLKQHRFRQAERRDFLCRALVETAAEFGWKLEAWAVFSNHYHLVARSPAEAEDAASLGTWQGKLHTATGEYVNLKERHTRTKSLAQLPRNMADVREKLLRPAQLHSPKCREARLGPGGSQVPMVLRRLVRTLVSGRTCEDDLQLQNR